MKREREWRNDVLRRLERLADRKVNDAVKLAFLSDEQLGEIDKLDLNGLTELKRHSNGAVEIKMVDKLLALEKLCQMAKAGSEGAEEFFQALERQAEDGQKTKGGSGAAGTGEMPAGDRET